MIDRTITILEKDGGFAVIAKQVFKAAPIGDPEAVVSSVDSRYAKPVFQKLFDTEEEATTNYVGAIRTSVKRGWSISYSGGQLNDPTYS
jgi:hypothetical protein